MIEVCIRGWGSGPDNAATVYNFCFVDFIALKSMARLWTKLQLSCQLTKIILTDNTNGN